MSVATANDVFVLIFVRTPPPSQGRKIVTTVETKKRTKSRNIYDHFSSIVDDNLDV